jgi:hypothetical protein
VSNITQRGFTFFLTLKHSIAVQELQGRIRYHCMGLRKVVDNIAKRMASFALAKSASKSVVSAGVHCTLQELLALRYEAKALIFSRPKVSPHDHSSQFMSVFRGRGLEFDTVRFYQFGDEARHIDWRVTARTRKPHVKLFHQERERSVSFLVDQTQSMHFGTRQEYKGVRAAKVTALLAWIALECNKKTGGVIFDEQHTQVFKNRSGEFGVLPLLQGLSNRQAPSLAPIISSKNPDNSLLLKQLQYFTHFVSRGSLSFIVSDFDCLLHEGNEQTKQTLERLLYDLAKVCDLYLILVYDPFETVPLPEGHYRLSNGQALMDMHFSPLKLRQAHSEKFKQRLIYLDALAQRGAYRAFAMATNVPLNEALGQVLNLRIGQTNFKDLMSALD